MEPIDPITYKKFKIQLFSPDGTFIKEGMINSEGVFYCPGLTPGQKYMIVFSYDDILLLIADFMCDTSGSVVYLSPAHFVFNNGISTITPNIGKELDNMIRRRKEYNVPFQLWEKKIITNHLRSSRGLNTLCGMKTMLPRFKAGAGLAKAVK